MQFAQILACVIGDRMRAGNAVIREMRHQVEKVRQFISRIALEQGQHVTPRLGGDEIIGIGNAGRDPFEIEQLAKRIVLQPGCQLLGRDGGIYGHNVTEGLAALL